MEVLLVSSHGMSGWHIRVEHTRLYFHAIERPKYLLLFLCMR